VTGSDIQADGVRAQQILDDDLMQRMLREAEKSVVDTMANLTIAHMADHTNLITLIQQLQAVRMLPDMLRDAVAAGKAVDRKPPAVA
jgi:hypothetical protein